MERLALLVSLVLMPLLLTTTVNSACLPEPRQVDTNREVINVGYGAWLSSEVNAVMLKIIIEEGLGYPVELVPLEAVPNFESLLAGVDIIFEMWATHSPEIILQLQNPIFHTVTDSGQQGRDGWYIPDYLLEFNPSFSNWRSLLVADNLQYLRSDYSGNITTAKNIYQKILEQTQLVANAPNTTTPEELAIMNQDLLDLVNSVQEGYPIQEPQYGELLTLDPAENWPTEDLYLIESLNLPLSVHYVDSPAEDNLIAAIIERYNQRKPFIAFLYSPLHIFDPRSGVNLERMQLLDWLEECEDGVHRPECVYPVDHIQIGTATTLPRKSVIVSEFMSKFKHQNTQVVNRMMAHVRFDGLSVEEAACKHILENKAYIESFYPPPQEVIFIDWNSGPGIALVIMTCVLIVLSLVIGFFLNVHRKNPVVMASSLRFCNAIVIGSIIGYSAIFTFLGLPNSVNCVFRPLLLATSFGVMYSYLLMKNFRIWRIFAKPFASSNKLLGDTNLLMAGSLVLIVEVILLIIWFAVDYPKPTFSESVTEIVLSCQSTDPVFGRAMVWTLFSFNCLLVLCGLFLAIETRRVSSRFRESTFIGLATYNVVVLGIVFIPFIAVDDLTSSMNKVVIFCVLILLVPFTTVAMLFIPKTLYIVKPELAPSYDSSSDQVTSQVKEHRKSSAKQTSSKGHKGSSVSDMKSEQKTEGNDQGNEEVGLDVLNQGLTAMKSGDYGQGY